jgi:hypothetical protein
MLRLTPNLALPTCAAKPLPCGWSMAARGEEEVGRKRDCAMCSQTLRGHGSAVSSLWETTRVRGGESEGTGMTTAPEFVQRAKEAQG